MKIRTGFVSNSSSSSFLLIFPPETSVGDIKTLGEYLINYWNTNEDYCQEEYDTREDWEKDGCSSYGIEEIIANVHGDEKFLISDVGWDGLEGVETLAKKLGARIAWIPD